MLTWLDIKKSFEKTEGRHSIEAIEDWRKTVLDRSILHIDTVPIQELKDWYEDGAGKIVHKTGKFFSVSGLRIQHQNLSEISWDQPVIDQREVGILGFLTSMIDGVCHFLVQAKIEPGNINFVQLSPTVQATRSNFTQAHKGKPVKYLDYFTNKSPIIDRLQSEQGGRFYRKMNRNMVVLTDDHLPEDADFRWMTLGQLFYFLQQENIVNMDTRTVLANLMSLDPRCSRSLSPLNNLSRERFKNHFQVKEIPLSLMHDWGNFDGFIRRNDENFFFVIGASVHIEGREVSHWDQPMIKPASAGICGLLVKPSLTSVSILVQYKFEFGLHHGVELAPTVQSLIGGRKLALTNQVPYVEFFSGEKSYNQTLYSAMQSEEGGRFFQEENSNQIILISSDDIYQNDRYEWMPLEDLMSMVALGGCVNIQLRNLALVLWLKGLMK